MSEDLDLAQTTTILKESEGRIYDSLCNLITNYRVPGAGNSLIESESRLSQVLQGPKLQTVLNMTSEEKAIEHNTMEDNIEDGPVGSSPPPDTDVEQGTFEGDKSDDNSLENNDSDDSDSDFGSYLARRDESLKSRLRGIIDRTYVVKPDERIYLTRQEFQDFCEENRQVGESEGLVALTSLIGKQIRLVGRSAEQDGDTSRQSLTDEQVQASSSVRDKQSEISPTVCLTGQINDLFADYQSKLSLLTNASQPSVSVQPGPSRSTGAIPKVKTTAVQAKAKVPEPPTEGLLQFEPYDPITRGNDGDDDGEFTYLRDDVAFFLDQVPRTPAGEPETWTKTARPLTKVDLTVAVSCLVEYTKVLDWSLEQSYKQMKTMEQTIQEQAVLIQTLQVKTNSLQGELDTLRNEQTALSSDCDRAHKSFKSGLSDLQNQQPQGAEKPRASKEVSKPAKPLDSLTITSKKMMVEKPGPAKTVQIKQSSKKEPEAPEEELTFLVHGYELSARAYQKFRELTSSGRMSAKMAAAKLVGAYKPARKDENGDEEVLDLTAPAGERSKSPSRVSTAKPVTKAVVVVPKCVTKFPNANTLPRLYAALKSTISGEADALIHHFMTFKDYVTEQQTAKVAAMLSAAVGTFLKLKDGQIKQLYEVLAEDQEKTTQLLLFCGYNR